MNLQNKKIIFFFFLSLFIYVVQKQIVTGNVTDENGIPLPGATVLVQGTNQGVSSDFDGNYSIEVSQGQSLEFSFVGYSSQIIQVGAASQINVQLLPDNKLEEVVVTALGIKRNTKAVGYSVTQVEVLIEMEISICLLEIESHHGIILPLHPAIFLRIPMENLKCISQVEICWII